LRFLVGFIASLAPESVLTALPERRPSVDEDGAGTHARDDDDDDDGDVDDDDDDEDDDAPESPDDEDATSGGSGPEALSIYLRQAGRIELLSAAQEVSLAKRIEAGLFAQERLDQRRYATVRERRDLDWLVSDGLRASELFVSSNLRLVLSIARRYVGHGLDIEDLIQEGNLGLIRAVQKFDYKQGFKFSTYATWWVRQAITRAMADQGRVIRLPVHVNEDYLKVRGTVRSLVKRGVDRPKAQQIAGEAELALEDVERLITWSRPVWSLDERLPAVGDERWGAESVDDFLTVSMSDVLVDIEYPESTDPHERVVRQEAVRHTHVLLDTLSEREAGVLAMRFGIVDGIPRTLDEIGKVYGVTRERIRQIEKVTLKRLRQDRAAEAFRQAWE